MKGVAMFAPILIQSALLLVALSALYSAYMLAVIGVVLARQRRLQRPDNLPGAVLDAPLVQPDRSREYPLAGARFQPVPTEAGQ